jgi:hypothetical protein
MRTLRGLIAPALLEQLVLTRTFWALQAPGISGLSYVARLVDVELDDRVSVLETACKDLEAQIARWSRNWEYVVPDTSYIQHPQKVEELDLRKHFRGPVHMLVPIVVVDELDELKEAKTPHVRWRARHTLAVLDEVLPEPTGIGVLRYGDFSPVLDGGGIPFGEVTVEIVTDPPGHARLPINDEEVIDRTLAIEALAGQRVTMITYDTGQSTRARVAGLEVVKIPQPPEGEEPERDGARQTAGRKRNAR